MALPSVFRPDVQLLDFQRSVAFDAREVMRAIAALPVLAGSLGLEAGHIRLVEFQPDQLAIVFASDDDEKRLTIIAAEALAALLVAYCADLAIPLPHQGQKTIRMTSDSVTLQVSVEVGTTPGSDVWKRRQRP